MTLDEFSNEFDIRYNNIATNSAPNIDEYEKSVYLTRAQLQLVKNYFNPRGNKYQVGFEQSSKRRTELSNLVTSYNTLTTPQGGDIAKFSTDSKFFLIPSDVFLIVDETIYVKDEDCGEVQSDLIEGSGLSFNIEKEIISNIIKTHKSINVIPKTHDELRVQSRNPFKKVNKNKAWRIDYNFYNYNSIFKTVEIVYPFNVSLYSIRYVKFPEPIILVNLDDVFPNENLSIYGRNTENNCKLFESIHDEIIDRAVELATGDYRNKNDLEAKISLNSRNE